MNDRFEPAVRLVVDKLVALVEVAIEPDVVDQQERVVLARRVRDAVVDDAESYRQVGRRGRAGKSPPIKQFQYRDAFRPPPARDPAADPKADHLPA